MQPIWANRQILLKLFFAPEGDPAAARDHVTAFREYHVARLEQFDAVAAPRAPAARRKRTRAR